MGGKQSGKRWRVRSFIRFLGSQRAAFMLRHSLYMAQFVAKSKLRGMILSHLFLEKADF